MDFIKYNKGTNKPIGGIMDLQNEELIRNEYSYRNPGFTSIKRKNALISMVMIIISLNMYLFFVLFCSLSPFPFLLISIILGIIFIFSTIYLCIISLVKMKKVIEIFNDRITIWTGLSKKIPFVKPVLRECQYKHIKSITPTPIDEQNEFFIEIILDNELKETFKLQNELYYQTLIEAVNNVVSNNTEKKVDSDFLHKMSYVEKGWTEKRRKYFNLLLYSTIFITITILLFFIQFFLILGDMDSSDKIMLIFPISIIIILIIGTLQIYISFETIISIYIYDNKLVVWEAETEEVPFENRIKNEYNFTQIESFTPKSDRNSNPFFADINFQYGKSISMEFNDREDFENFEVLINDLKEDSLKDTGKKVSSN